MTERLTDKIAAKLAPSGWIRDDADDRWAAARMTGAQVGGCLVYFTPGALALFLAVVVLAVIGWAR